MSVDSMQSAQNTNQEQDAKEVSLTSRQQQILSLMKEGKVNKEIANELGISLGTVKQHAVAIFKKLNVTNRTMAVSQSAVDVDKSKSIVTGNDGMLAQRPCLVLSLNLKGDSTPEEVRHLYSTLAELALDTDALFMARELGAADLIFGLKRSSKQDIWVVLALVNKLYRGLTEQDQKAYSGLYGALTAGFVTVSQNRFGGWSGEAVASPIISNAQQTLSKGKAGVLYFDKTVRGIIRAFGLGKEGVVPHEVELSNIKNLCTWDSGFDIELIGRDSELDYLMGSLFSRAGSTAVMLEGESGMGKSRLCRELVRESERKKIPVYYYHLLPSGLWNASAKVLISFDSFLKQLQEQSSVKRTVITIIDDCHLLLDDQWPLINETLKKLSKYQKVLFSGRRSVKLVTESLIDKVHLKRLSQSETKELLRERNPEVSEKQLRDWISQSRGVPLFATELAMNEETDLPLSLVVVVAARLDAFKVDWKLLYALSNIKSVVQTKELGKQLGDSPERIQKSVDRAVEIGVLEHHRSGEVRYRHPLVQNIVACLSAQ